MSCSWREMLAHITVSLYCGLCLSVIIAEALFDWRNMMGPGSCKSVPSRGERWRHIAELRGAKRHIATGCCLCKEDVHTRFPIMALPAKNKTDGNKRNIYI